MRKLKEQSQGGDFPSNWTTTGRTRYNIVDVGAGSDEYQLAVQVFQETCHAKVTRVQRVESPDLYITFRAKVKSLENDACKSKNVDLRWLWHGCANDTVEFLCTQGWDKSYAGERVGKSTSLPHS